MAGNENDNEEGKKDEAYELDYYERSNGKDDENLRKDIGNVKKQLNNAIKVFILAILCLMVLGITTLVLLSFVIVNNVNIKSTANVDGDESNYSNFTFPNVTEEPFPTETSAKSVWIKIFSHNTAGGLFSSQEDALTKNPDNPEADLYSILDSIGRFRNEDGSFHLKLCYPEVTGVNGSHCNEWTQSSNPANQTTITNFQAISLAFDVNSAENPWIGLGRSPSNYPQTLIDDYPAHSWWWMAIGATQFYKEDGIIPGPRGTDPAEGHKVRKVELYVYHKL